MLYLHLGDLTGQTDLFDEQVLSRRLDKKTVPLARLGSACDWQTFLPVLEVVLRRNQASPIGRKPYPGPLMLRIVVLQTPLQSLQ